MLIQLGYDIEFYLSAAVPFVSMLNVHPSRSKDLWHPDCLHTAPSVPVQYYKDVFGNICARFIAQPGNFRLYGNNVIEDSGEPDAVNWDARQWPVEDLPSDVLQFLLASRYCEVDLLTNTAFQWFGHVQPGWGRVQAICDWVNSNVTFGYEFARPTRTANEVLTERRGVCRDFQHLAITLCRCMNIPARYATGYLGDIGVPGSPLPMDFSAWFEVYLGDRWWTWDARHNKPRIGRVLMATGRDAADVAITTCFGSSLLTKFTVVTKEMSEADSSNEMSEIAMVAASG